MTLAQIQRLHEAAPFRPLDLFLADGRILYIGHPEYLSILPGGGLITVYQDSDIVEFVDLGLVVSFRFGEPELNLSSVGGGGSER